MDESPEMDLGVVGHLLALLAHDLRNPLSALHSNLGFLGSVIQCPDEDVSEALSDGLVSCDGLSHIIDNLDLLGQSLRGARQADGLPFSVVALVRDVAHRCEQTALSHGLELCVDYSSMGADLEAWGNRDLLARSLGNLIRNSLQLSPSGSVVEIRAAKSDSGVDVFVFDQGTRLSDEMATLAFTARGQIGSKGSGEGRYSRGVGLMSAQIAAAVSGASVTTSPAADGFQSGFVLRLRSSAP